MVMAFALAVSCTETTHPRVQLTKLTTIPDSVIIPIEQAQQMVANYAPRAGYVEREGQQLPNTRSIWMDLDVIEAFVAQLRANDASGIRFYLAAYDATYAENDMWQNVPPSRYWDYNTVLLVPTDTPTAEGLYPDYLTQPDHAEATGSVTLAAPPIINRGEISPPDSTFPVNN